MYAARSYDPEYAQLISAVTAGDAELLFEGFLPAGHKEIIVAPLTRRNPEVKISARKFKITLKEYNSWKSSWWREVIQNSVDAGATNVYLSVTKGTDDAGQPLFVVSCTDDGAGMDDNILFNKFLTIGESGKEGAQTVGGFGVAKELILFPWISWTIHTRNRLVRGAGLSYEVLDTPFLQGTKVEVVMPKDNATLAYYARAILSKSLFPDVAFHVKDEDSKVFATHVADLVGQRLVSTAPGDFARVYFTPTKHPTSYIMVRVIGPRGALFMFDKWCGTELPGQFIAEIDGSKSTSFLNSNRDGFSSEGSDLEHLITDIAVQAAKDTKSFARRFQNLFKRVYAGDPTLRFQARLEQAAAVDAVAGSGGVEAPAEEIKRKLDEVVEQARQKDQDEAREKAAQGHAQNNYRSEVPPGQLVDDIVAGVMQSLRKGAGQDSLETMAKQLVWRPPFVLINEIPDFVPAASFFPETMERRAVRLLKVWGEMCRQVMIALNCPKPYGVGFLFSTKAGAAYVPYDAEAYTGDVAQVDGFLVLNPVKKSRSGKQRMLDPRKDFNWLWSAAVHECTHMVDGIGSHDEEFTSAFTHNNAKALPWLKRSRRILSQVGLEEGLSAKEAARVTRALQKDLAAKKREAFRQRVEEGHEVPHHEFAPARGRSPADPEDRKCSVCGRKRREH